eukprot:TRINITY_DN6061_c0_g1_i1.p1 TRINITY_DN6061_c0_g1~~TRINITY_DN6061_c0_g1_i1.p1  ORF type:complete len:889 (+),score=96.31 TRINITY_DN6061_c0_g1_i1:82-2748(+)
MLLVSVGWPLELRHPPRNNRDLLLSRQRALLAQSTSPVQASTPCLYHDRRRSQDARDSRYPSQFATAGYLLWACFSHPHYKTRREHRAGICHRRSRIACLSYRVHEAELLLNRLPEIIAEASPLGTRVPRSYQRAATECFFSKLPDAAKTKRALRFQMAGGSGKTFVFGMIILEDLQTNPGAQYVIFVPWRDLAKQTCLELAQLGLNSCIVGDGQREIDTSATVTVCVYASAHRLENMTFRIKLVDEAHHLEHPYAKGPNFIKIRRNVVAELTADFTATFHDSQTYDFNYGLDQAIEEGVCTPFRIHMAYLLPGRYLRMVARLFADYRDEWAPALIVFNRKARAKRCTRELAMLGVRVEYVCSNSTREHREAAKLKLESGEVEALCVVGVFNEGTSISPLRTLVFGDRRRGSINVQQTTMRVTRRHDGKAVSNVVVPVGAHEQIWTQTEFRELVRSLTNLSPQLGRRIVAQDREWIRPVVQRDQKNSPSSDYLKRTPDKFYIQMFDQLGRCLHRPGPDAFEQSVELLRQWVVQHQGRVPKATKVTATEHQHEEQAWGKWLAKLVQARRRGRITDKQLDYLAKQIPELAERVRHIRCSAAQEAADLMTRCKEVQMWMQQNNNQSPNKHSEDAVERKIGLWVNNARMKWRIGLLSTEQKSYLEQELPDLFAEDVFSKTLPKRATDDLGARAVKVRSWIQQHSGALPRKNSADAEERHLARWLAYLRQQRQYNRFPDRDLAHLLWLVPQLSPWAERLQITQRDNWLKRCTAMRDWLDCHGAPPGPLEAHHRPNEQKAELSDHWHDGASEQCLISGQGDSLREKSCSSPRKYLNLSKMQRLLSCQRPGLLQTCNRGVLSCVHGLTATLGSYQERMRMIGWKDLWAHGFRTRG